MTVLRSGTEAEPVCLRDKSSVFSLLAGHACMVPDLTAHSKEDEAAHNQRTIC